MNELKEVRSKRHQDDQDDVECSKLNGVNMENFAEIDSGRRMEEAHWLLRRIYILSWLRYYDRDKALSDLIAGITLGLTIIPQSIAYAALAGLTSEYGLYSAFIGSIIYVAFGTIPQVSIGPTSLMALMTWQYCYEKPVQLVTVLALIAGIIEFLMGILDLGFIVNFIPSPVTKAFTTGTALIVTFVQLKNLLGINVKGRLTPRQFYQNIQLPDAVLGAICLTLLIGLKQLANIKLPKSPWRKFLWYVSISRNALVVFGCGVFVYLWNERWTSKEPLSFKMTTKVESAWPTFVIPSFTFTHNATTYQFFDICRELGGGIIVVPIVAVLANVAIAKAFVKDKTLDASQEMLTLGLCNITGSFFSAMPTCGAFTRSAVSQASGVKTPMAGIYTGIIVLLAITYLTPFIQYIPKSTLSAVLIAAIIFMADFKPMFQLWNSSKRDFFSWSGCLIVCLVFGVEICLFYGIIYHMAFILLRLAKPSIKVSSIKEEFDGDDPCIRIEPLSDIYYSGLELLRMEITAACHRYRYRYGDHRNLTILLECSRFQLFDSTFIDILNTLAKELAEKKVVLMLQSLTPRQQRLLNLNNTNPYVHFINAEYFGNINKNVREAG